ncbi:YheC/YheD family endospore coat-associated protein [Ferviditalea candida]|uniref:YheC/YheD family protein n=1 Tax=Ferviditalea candida TaxID=3108399 RepID=A0ABU5ZE94_9BACL|nr:YheC/YheD family protein [Paenibacillaceae bacterium T2]
MTKMKVMIHVYSTGFIEDGQTLFLSESFMRNRKIPEGRLITLRYGSFIRQVQAFPVRSSGELRIHQQLARDLGLHHGTQLRLKYHPGTLTLRIGPLIGVLVSRIDPDDADKRFGAMTAYCKELTDACRSQGAFVYFFTPGDIEHGKDRIEGWSYNGSWNKAYFPLADVIHNRLTSRKLENKPSVQYFVKEVKSHYDASVFNEKYLSKNEVFQALTRESGLLKYLPESYAFKNYRILKTMCEKYRSVFLKPARGSLGKGIIRIMKQADGSYICHFTNVNGTKREQFASLSQVFCAISGKMKTMRYQIQQGLQLIEIDGRPVDFRVLVQKNRHGRWSVTSIVGRIAGSQQFVSNLARGGSLCTVSEALSKSNLNSHQRGSVYPRLKASALEIAAGIEAQIPYHFGELGIDLAVEPDGSVWLLEVNSKPSKNDNAPLSSQRIRPSVKRVIQYSLHLSGFRGEES